MTPRRAADFTLAHLLAFDDEALSEFLRPGEAGVDPRVLGVACQAIPDTLAARVEAAMSPPARLSFAEGRALTARGDEIDMAERVVVERLFWPLLYWHDPATYEQLVGGEAIHPRILEAVPVDGRSVCDVGAGAGRFALWAARRARRVVAVDAIPSVLERLRQRAEVQGVCNLEIRRSGFARLAVGDAEVDVAVSCSAVTSRSPFGGDDVVAEMERVVRPGGWMVVIWPDRPGWFVRRGFRHVHATGNRTRDFDDPLTAERLCRDFYGEAAAAWVRAHGAHAVPYAVLGVRPPNDMCIRRRDANVSGIGGASSTIGGSAAAVR
ncbi:MAG: methyltransferase domain-containing protein [Candidatus Dormibacteria bacterium]